MSVICRRFLLKLVLSTQIFLKLSHASTLSKWTKEIQAKSEEWTTQTSIYYDTFWLQSFGTRNSSLSFFGKCKNFCVTVNFSLFYFEFEGNFRVQAPGSLHLEERFIGGFIFGILRYIIGISYHKSVLELINNQILNYWGTKRGAWKDRNHTYQSRFPLNLFQFR